MSRKNLNEVKNVKKIGISVKATNSIRNPCRKNGSVEIFFMVDSFLMV